MFLKFSLLLVPLINSVLYKQQFVRFPHIFDSLTNSMFILSDSFKTQTFYSAVSQSDDLVPKF